MGIMGPGNEDGNLWAALPRLNSLTLTSTGSQMLVSVADEIPRSLAVVRLDVVRDGGASGSEWSPPCLRGLAVVELDRPLGAGGACKGPDVARAPRGRLRQCGRLSLSAVGPGVTVFSTTRPHPFARGADKASENRA